MTEEVLRNIGILGKSRSWIDTPANIWGYGIKADNTTNGSNITSPFIDYILEDKSGYPLANTVVNPKTNKNWIDDDEDFLIGKSGGLLMKIDFIFINTDIFSRVGDYHRINDKYCPYEEGTDKYEKFWRRETERRRKGVKAKCKLYFKDIDEYFNPKTTEERKKELLHYVRITGDHYNYLNYGVIERTPSDEEKIEFIREGRHQVNTVAGRPRFWDADYWYFKTDEFIIRNEKNMCLAKARRKGVSYKRASSAANRVNMNKNVTVVLAADILDYLTDPEATADMAKKNLEHYENTTYWKRGFLSESLEAIELGYKRKKEGNKKYGFRSKILAVAIGRNESAAVGKKAIDIDFEEAGKSPNLQKAWNVTLSNIEVGAKHIGTGRMYGTAGTKNANWAAFSNIFYSPAGNNMIEFENIWNHNARHKTCGFFIPNIWSCEPYIWDGNSLLLDAWKWDIEDKANARRTQKTDDAIVYIAQRANSPAEAFIDTQENLFSSPVLNDHIQDLMDSPSKRYYTDGWYVREAGDKVSFLNKAQCINKSIFGGKFHEYIVDVPHNSNTDIHGCVREYFPPYKDDKGITPDDLYFITVDTYRVDKDKENVGIKNSLYSIQCWMRINPYTQYAGKRLVAEYCGRLDTMAQNDAIALDMALRYHCGVLPEAGTGEIVSNFKTWGYRNKLMLDPSHYTERSVKTSTNVQYGVVVGDTEKKLEGLRYLRDFLYEVVGKTENGAPVYRLNSIDSLALCLELQRYSLAGNFDRVSSAIVAMFEFKKDFALLKESVERNTRANNGPGLKELLKRKLVRR